MKDAMRRSAPVLLPLVLALACGDGESPPADNGGTARTASGSTVQENPLHFEVWHADFPYPVHISPGTVIEPYRFSAPEAVERIVDKLMGNCTPPGWNMAMQWFNRAPESAIPMLIEAMDRAMQSKERSDLVQNITQAMGQMGRYRRPELAEALLRALRHPKKSVRDSAMGGLIGAGTAETVRKARVFVEGLQPRGQGHWLRAVRRHLPDTEVEAIYTELLGSPGMMSAFNVLVEESTKLPLPIAARVLGSVWESAPPSLRLTIAGTMHAAGDLRGTRMLSELLRSGTPDTQALAVLAAARGKLDYLRDDILKLSLVESVRVRHSVALTIGTWPGENIDNILETMAADPAPDVRQTALNMLRGRGQRASLDELISRVRTASGSKLVQALGDLSAAGDGQAAVPMVERMRTAPHEEWRKYLQALGLSRTVEAFTELEKIFLEPEVPIDATENRTSLTYIAEILSNIDLARVQILDLYSRLPREDYRRRACLLDTLNGLGSVTKDEAFAQSVTDLFRSIIQDSDDIPQMRLLALQFLRRDLRIDDMKAILKLYRSENGPIRKALSDFLWEFF